MTIYKKKYSKYNVKLHAGRNIKKSFREEVINTDKKPDLFSSINYNDFLCCIEKIGNGQFGNVDKGIDEKTGKTIIIKKIDLGGKSFRKKLLSKDYQYNTELNDTRYENITQTYGLKNMFDTKKETNGSNGSNENKNINTMIEKIVKKLDNEISIMKSLHHDNIIKYIGHIEKYKDDNENNNDIFNKELYIYMEDVCGKSLSEISKILNGLSLRLIYLYTKQILNALEYIHSKKILHMDIKGDNIILSNTGIIKLIDFGESIRNGDGVTEFKIPYCGTLLFIAPELFGETEILIDMKNFGKTDIWSFGVFIVEIFVGNMYFPQNTNKNNFNDIIVIVIKNLFAKIEKILNDDKVNIINEDDYQNVNIYTTFTLLLEKAFYDFEGINLLLFLELVSLCLTIDQNNRKNAKDLFEHTFFDQHKYDITFDDYFNDKIEALMNKYENFLLRS